MAQVSNCISKTSYTHIIAKSAVHCLVSLHLDINGTDNINGRYQVPLPYIASDHSYMDMIQNYIQITYGMYMV